MDRTLLNLVSIGRESEPARIEKLERMKKEMLDYAASRKNESERPMSYLYDEFQLPVVAEMLSYIAEVSLLQDFKEIDWDDKAQIEAVEDFDSIRMTIALLSYFTVLVNENFRKTTSSICSLTALITTTRSIAIGWASSGTMARPGKTVSKAACSSESSQIIHNPFNVRFHEC